MRPRSRRGWLSAIAVVLVLLLAGGGLTAALNRPVRIREVSQFVAATPEPGGAPVRIDTTLFLPPSLPAPAVILAHGLGATKASMVDQARALARHGYVVLTFTARGFGASGGLVHLDSLDYEVKDASRLVDFLEARPEVEHVDGAGVIGVGGASYGGALALMLGATDHRISAVAADISWNNLGRVLFPNGAQGQGGGVYKKLWAGYLFSVSQSPSASGPTVTGDVAAPGCGRFAADVCALYHQAGTSTGATDTALYRLLLRSSPATVLGQMKAPTLVTQGEQDSLFPLGEADATIAQLRQAGVQLQVRWRAGGHDADVAGDDVAGWQQAFFDQKLKHHDATAGDGGFLFSDQGSAISATNGQRINRVLRADAGYPAQPSGTSVTVAGPPQTIVAPADGSPAAVTAIPALGSVLNAASSLGVTGALSLLPRQVAAFTSAALPAALRIVGGSDVTLTVAPGPGTSVSTATLFVSLRDSSGGASLLPANLVTPVRVALTGATPVPVTVHLPWIVADVPAGHRLQVVVSTTDFGYQLPSDARTYTVALAGAGAAALTVPTVPASVTGAGSIAPWPVAALVVLLLCAAFLLWRARRSRRRRGRAFDPVLAEVPIAIEHLVKEYADGYRAVDDVSFSVERGQVLGLLGPNGAGKTTTLRVLMGLILPTEGSVRVFGHEVVPGAAVLSRLGAFVEGPGLLPHLSGAENLRLYWGASGRPEAEAEFDTVLEIAGLGDSLQRRVKAYSHGMQQRLAIAQAMLGLPEVLVLDEPTNGLDPPQIAEMREVLQRYAATGRTVVVSSHLLAEVEQTCTHVVVRATGRVVAAGSVADVVGTGSEQVDTPDPARAVAVLRREGIEARTVPGRRALEEVFLDLIGERDV